MQVIPNFRVRTIPVLGTMPATLGMAAAAHILCQLAQQPFTPEPIFRIAVRPFCTGVCFCHYNRQCVSTDFACTCLLSSHQILHSAEGMSECEHSTACRISNIKHCGRGWYSERSWSLATLLVLRSIRKMYGLQAFFSMISLLWCLCTRDHPVMNIDCTRGPFSC